MSSHQGRICELCKDQIFNTDLFPRIFVKSDFDYELGGLWFKRSFQELSSGCKFCRLVTQSINVDNFKTIATSIRTYAVPRDGRPDEDISTLFIDAGLAGRRSFGIHADADDIASQSISTREPNPIVSSPSAFKLVREWIRTCDENHEQCKHQLLDMPTRVLDLASGHDKDVVKLFETEGMKVPYTTLSYCWGAPQPRMLVKSNYSDYRLKINLSTLPRSIRDAILVVRELGIRYLWVDSLCILQDSPEDKAHEIAQMAHIYQNSFLTILASSATTCEDGFLTRQDAPKQEDATPLPFLGLDGNVNNGTMLVRFSGPHNDYDPAQDPANLRAWIFQERILSPRLLVYPSVPHPIQWRCLTVNKTDGGPALQASESGMEQLSSHFYNSRQETNPTEEDDTKLRRLWARILQNYTSRYLSVGTDKLPAMAGVASEFARVRGEKAGAYCAGLWRNDMPLNLLWRLFPIDHGQYRDQEGHGEARAPSWSWVSTNTQVVLPSQSPTHPFRFKILDCKVELVQSQLEFGEVKQAQLVVEALLKICLWNRHSQTLGDGDIIVGKGVADDIEAMGEKRVWCMPVLEAEKYPSHMTTGLLLESSGKYFKRVGVLILRKHNWFEDSKEEIFTII